ncbi:uncharacterized protein BDZ99DRAFT_468945 [Mytilinidion resinicola]|uniref:Uncharacterized protein n=1 Tax=Mytilinidion resinicola TaxID=574789 RepID=A0A6A6Y1I4_9PEZI|nr:uncharacterized protein BDZ99DRAFT_468945 [Mytilinidion resinicola]KAF2802499.1 hypothetical protein BDZ99DRAFT_468945 [Mytilinidion resinicola]
MSPNGTLLAYSVPVDIKDLRDQAALISMAWKEHEEAIASKLSHDQASLDSDIAQSSSSLSKSTLETLTIEFEANNLIVRALQPKLLLVLVGGVPPGRNASFKITPEVHGDPRYPHSEAPSSKEGSLKTAGIHPKAVSDIAQEEGFTIIEGATSPKPSVLSIADSHMSQRDRDLQGGALHIQRKKIDAMTDYIRRDFDSKGFVMPDDSMFP